MSNRRKTRQERESRKAARATTAAADNPMEGMEPWLWAVKDADEAERRGDAAGALEVILRRPLDAKGQPFWTSARVRRVRQLDELAGDLPAWVHSRWILAQAVHDLDEHDPMARTKRLRALEIARELSGLDGGEDWMSVSLMDHDWFYRQVLLFEQGALVDFLGRASADLVAGADRIAEWAAAPMGGFVYRGSTGGRSTWTDLATDTEIGLDDIGAGSMLAPDVPAIGRLVPAGDGLMFESIPQEASLEVARAVAKEPSRWLEIVRAAGHEFSDGEIISHVDEFGLVTDMAHMQWLTWLSEWRQPRAHAFQVDAELLARAIIDRAATELELSEHRYLPAGEQYDEEEQVGWEPWLCLTAPLLEPGVLDAFRQVVRADDLTVLGDLRDRVAEPVRSLLTGVISEWRAAA